MNFTESIHRLDAYHTAWLESSGRDDVSLDYAVNAAVEALRQVPPARLAILSPEQREEIANLRQLHEQAVVGASRDRPNRQAWLKAAREILLLLRV